MGLGGKLEPLELNGAQVFSGYLDAATQADLVAAVRSVVAQAPLFHPVTASGQKMSVRMTSAGTLGWVSDKGGYRYQPAHPNGTPWPAIPDGILRVWRDVSGTPRDPDCCLVNYYDGSARMGLHQDRDEAEFDWPVVSISLGDDGLFRIATPKGRSPSSSVWLRSGDVVVLSGAARMAYHGIDRIKPNTSPLLQNGGRLNLTLRVAGPTGGPSNSPRRSSA
ncbi:MAG: alpha-ketoglutarate-dependent dioxygenase AlkB [Pseudomonadota bacterium]